MHQKDGQRQIEEVADIEKSYQWLEKAGLKDSIEALIMAALNLNPEYKSNRGRGLSHQIGPKV